MQGLLARCVVACVFQAAAALCVAPARAAGEMVVREQRNVAVGGVDETWRLVWDGPPASICGPDAIATAFTCPCSGVGYGELGHLSLVRNRGGRDIERMDFGPLFDNDFDSAAAGTPEGSAYLQRWPMKLSDFDRDDRGDPTLVADIKRRPAPRIMRLADYGRDGAATQFLVQVGTLPCGKQQFVAIGLTRGDRSLHALTSVSRPEKPLIMPEAAWQALLRGPGPTRVPTWACGDHGSESRSELVVAAKNGAIRVQERMYSCPMDGAVETLLRETDE